MRTITTIGLDIAKSVFQVHGIDVVGQVVMRRLKFFEKLPLANVRFRGKSGHDADIAACLLVTRCRHPFGDFAVMHNDRD
jgi:transposase